MISNQELEKIILKSKILAETEFKKIGEQIGGKKVNLAEYLVNKNFISENLLYETIANYYNLPFIDLKNKIVRRDILVTIPEPIVQSHQIVAFEDDEKSLKIACLDPQDLQTFEFIKKKTGRQLQIHLTTPQAIGQVLKQYHKGLKAEFKEITKIGDEADKVSATDNLKKLAQDLPVIRIVDTLLEYAVFEGASDIHIEPTEKETVVRYRIDGILRDVMSLPKTVQGGLVARIKILSNLKIDEHRLPQDGRFKIATSEYKVAFRVSIIPVFDGEKVELRLLNESAQIISLEKLGLNKSQLNILERGIKKPHGIILVTGPTGSGKTTTLYSVLNVLNTAKVNISTVEDPVEYRIPRVNQSQINPRIGFTFAKGLRAILRQDPNVIMVGEIRDEETAEISTHAAMTGHLVLSTLHTNDAISSPGRLIEMKVPAFLVASTTNLIIAQRLVRKLCINCIESYNLTKKNIEAIENQINFKFILEFLKNMGFVISPKTPLESLLFYRGKGCKQCNMEGYKGRIGIYELLEITKEMSQLILNNAAEEKLEEQALKQGMITMIQDGFLKAKNGLTSIEEVLRVTKE